jgi:hypothetical protein
MLAVFNGMADDLETLRAAERGAAGQAGRRRRRRRGPGHELRGHPGHPEGEPERQEVVTLHAAQPHNFPKNMQSQQLIGGNLCLAKAGLTGLSGAATTFTTANAICCTRSSARLLTKAAVAGGATPTVDGVTGNPITIKVGNGTNVLWCVDAAGNVKCVQGSQELLDAAGNFAVRRPAVRQRAGRPSPRSPTRSTRTRTCAGAAPVHLRRVELESDRPGAHGERRDGHCRTVRRPHKRQLTNPTL